MDTIEIEEMFSALGPVSIRRMFGGKGIYHQGLIIAVEIGGQILLKADTASAPRFAEAGATQWGYAREGRAEVLMPYWSIPEDAYDDPDLMAGWARLAYEAATRAGTGKPKPAKVSAGRAKRKP